MKHTGLRLQLILFATFTMQSGCRPQINSAIPPSDPTSRPSVVTVFAAASLNEAYTEIEKSFVTGQPEARVLFNFAGSQQLSQQLVQGAQADVFASADEENMRSTVEAGRVANDRQLVFAYNRLVVVMPGSNPGRVQSLQDLAKPGLKLVLGAAQVPVGRYSMEFLDKASQDAEFGPRFKEGVLSNVVSYEENVRAVFSKVALGEADAGIVFNSDTISSTEEVLSLQIPERLNAEAAYFIAPVSDSTNPDLAEAFIAFVLSQAGQDIMSRYGFITIR